MSEKDVQEKLMGKEVFERQITAVQAYFACNSVESTRYSEHQKPLHKVKFGALYGNKEGSLSKDYCDATPSGECWLSITDGYPAAQFFKPGRRYFLTFTEAPND